MTRINVSEVLKCVFNREVCKIEAKLKTLDEVFVSKFASLTNCLEEKFFGCGSALWGEICVIVAAFHTAGWVG